MVKKNDKINLEIIDMVNEGLGLARLDNQVYFVKDALIGDTVEAIVTKVTKNIIYAKTVRIIEASKDRVLSKCKNANACGGCQLLNLSYEKQLELKKKNTISCLNRIGNFDISTDVELYEGIIGSANPCLFRNKMQVPYGLKNGKVTYGFYAGRTHYIIPFDFCMVGFKGAEVILESIREMLEKNDISIYDEVMHQGVFREVLLRCGNVSGEVSITYIINDKKHKKSLALYKKFDSAVRESISTKLSENDAKDIKHSLKIVTTSLNINTSCSNVLLGNENILLNGSGYINDNIGEIKFHISPESFYQVNMEMTKKLYDKVLEYDDFNGNENVLDLYCGIGTISLYLAKSVKRVLGVDIVKRAIDDAKENAKINNIKNAEFVCMDLGKSEAIDELSKAISYDIDTIIVDPPRKGLDDKIIELIKELNPKKIVYVSCDPATLARDLDIICHKNDRKYNVKKIVNVDMFPHTMHVETVTLIVAK